MDSAARQPAGSDHQPVTTALATELVWRYIDAGLTVTRVSRLYGGSVNEVQVWETDGEPGSVVAKLHATVGPKTFERERGSLMFYRRHTDFPVPEPYACITNDPVFLGNGLLMEKIEGVTLVDARLSPTGFGMIQRQLADHVAQLHRHERQTYGSALSERGSARWLDVFSPMIEKEFGVVRAALSSRTRAVVDDLLQHLDAWLPPADRAVLVHGDLWATNIMVDDRHPDRPRIAAFIDGNASYCDAEYELAYLRVFRTVDEAFFNRYRRYHALREGFDRRCRVYWLNTMMMHVRVFGERYLPACEDLAEQIRRSR